MSHSYYEHARTCYAAPERSLDGGNRLHVDPWCVMKMLYTASKAGEDSEICWHAISSQKDVLDSNHCTFEAMYSHHISSFNTLVARELLT